MRFASAQPPDEDHRSISQQSCSPQDSNGRLKNRTVSFYLHKSLSCSLVDENACAFKKFADRSTIFAFRKRSGITTNFMLPNSLPILATGNRALRHHGSVPSDRRNDQDALRRFILFHQNPDITSPYRRETQALPSKRRETLSRADRHECPGQAPV